MNVFFVKQQNLKESDASLLELFLFINMYIFYIFLI